ncbi:hypothetical protein [Aurantivibrio infirmus]
MLFIKLLGVHMASEHELNEIVGKTAILAQYLEMELGTILLVQEANENNCQELIIDFSKAYEKLSEKVAKNTLGASLRKLTSKINHQDDIVSKMGLALKARNRFTHHIFREYGLAIHTEEGRDKIISDIDSLNQTMQKAYNIAQSISEDLVMEHVASVKKNS